MLFSKSSYTAGLQCPRRLWLERNMPQLALVEQASEAKLKNGQMVGDVAKRRFGDYVEIEQTFDFEQMAQKTASLIERRVPVICEATFVADGLVCMVDILQVSTGGVLDIIEVKSSTSSKPYHIEDATFQAYVAACAGYTVDSVSIMHLNKDYVLDGRLDLDELFTIEDVTSQVGQRADAIRSKIDELEHSSESGCEPAWIAPARHCTDPFECPFIRHCTEELVPEWMWGFSGIGTSKAIAYASKGVRTTQDLAAALTKGRLGEMQMAQCEAEASDGAYVDKRRLNGFLEGIAYPVAHLDFETIQPAVPVFQKTKPWSQIPTQFSIHIQDEPGGKARHIEYLAPAGVDPRRGLAEALIDAIPDKGTVLAYNRSFEMTRIREMAQTFNDLSDALLAINDRIIDLMVPFKSGIAYHPQMHGSASIKKVLPAFFPDDPELDYHALDGVHNGTEAMGAFEALSEMGKDEQQVVREQLLHYCELDTYAMVKLLDRLYELAA